MPNIILKVPEGDHCKGCMFLDIDYLRAVAVCNLFNKVLKSRASWGELLINSIEKTSSCPNEDESDDLGIDEPPEKKH